MSIADRALQAHQAKVEADQAELDAQIARRRERAVIEIGRIAEEFGIPFDPDRLEPGYGGMRVDRGRTWNFAVPVDDDATLTFKAEFGYVSDNQFGVTLKVQACDQLYWDLPPGQEEKERGGGTYGCYSLEDVHKKEIGTLADLGAALVKIRKAREQWRKKHNVRPPRKSRAKA